MLNIDEAIKAFQDFESRASAKRETQMSRIKEDRSILAGDQWSKQDKKMLGRGRSKRTINITANAVNNVVNNYLGFPYAYFSGDNELDGMLAAWLKTKSNAKAVSDGLRGSVSFGLNYLCMGTDTISDDQGSMEIPVVYTVADVTNIYFDPDSVSDNGDDAMEAAIVELRSKTYVKNKFGEKFLFTDGTTPTVHVNFNHNEDMMAVVTYYKIEDNRCTCYCIVGDKFLYDPVQLPINRVPIVPVYGEQTWGDDGDEILWQGVVRKATPIQQLINIGFTQLGERMLQAPKPTITADPEAVEGYTEQYKNFCYTLNPLLLYNPKSADGKRDLQPPTRTDNTVQYSDLTGIIGSNLELMSSVVGVDSRAVFDTRTELTATEVLTSQKQYQTQIRHYFDNLRSSFKAVGEMVLQLFGYGNINLTVTQGPDEYLQRQIARNELITLAGIVPDQQKVAIVDGILMASGNNAILRDTYNRLHQVPAPTAMEEQMGMTIEQMKAAIEERDQKMQEMQEQIDYYEKSSRDQAQNLEAHFAELGVKHEQEMEKMAFKAELAAADTESRLQQQELKHQDDLETVAFKAELDAQDNAAQRQADAILAGMEVEKEGIALDTARVKAAAEQTKAITGALAPKEVKNEDRTAV